MHSTLVTSHRNFIRAALVAFGLACSAGVSAAAVDSGPTDTVKGRAPTATPTYVNTSRPGQPPVDGETVTVTPGFNDVDHDDEYEIKYVWKRNGDDIAGETTESYTLTPADIGATLTVEVMPSTDPTITDPHLAEAPGIATITTGTTASDKPISVAIYKGGTLLVGNPIVGDVLEAVPTCLTTCSTSLTYTWTADAQGVGTNSANYTVTKDDQKKVIIVSVE